MNRRSFLALFGAIPIWVAPGGATPTATMQHAWVRRDFEPLDPSSALLGIHAMAVQYEDEAAASDPIGQLAIDGFIHEPGVTADDFPPLEILAPPGEIALPAAMRSYEGAAPVSSGLDTVPYVTFDVQREAVLVSITVRGSAESDLFDVATDLMLVMLDYSPSWSEPMVDESGRHSGGLWDFLLQEDDAPDGFRLDHESDENGGVQITD